MISCNAKFCFTYINLFNVTRRWSLLQMYSWCPFLKVFSWFEGVDCRGIWKTFKFLTSRLLEEWIITLSTHVTLWAVERRDWSPVFCEMWHLQMTQNHFIYMPKAGSAPAKMQTKHWLNWTNEKTPWSSIFLNTVPQHTSILWDNAWRALKNNPTWLDWSRKR